ncbi:MAG: hypothetical protein IJU40_01210 [Desulfovibrionaceae bacterium]|nr:hypothetical protein [Desulfovibrionaceae bacterium]
MKLSLFSLNNNQGFNLGPAALLVLSIMMTIAVALAYVGGVMSGRASAERECRWLYTDAYKVLEEESDSKAATKIVVEEEGETKILAPEELEFARVLRNEQRLAMRGQGHLKQISAVQDNASPSEVAKSKDTAKDDAKTPPKKILYDYIYQVAAVRGNDNADALRQRLEGRGFHTFLKKQGKLLLISVKLRGEANLGGQVVSLLEQMHLGRPILISKKKVENKR